MLQETRGESNIIHIPRHTTFLFQIYSFFYIWYRLQLEKISTQITKLKSQWLIKQLCKKYHSTRQIGKVSNAETSIVYTGRYWSELSEYVSDVITHSRCWMCKLQTSNVHYLCLTVSGRQDMVRNICQLSGLHIRLYDELMFIATGANWLSRWVTSLLTTGAECVRL